MVRDLETSNANYKEKLEELEQSGGILAATDNLVSLVTNRSRFPGAPAFLPQFLLLKNKKILTLKKKMNIVKYQNRKQDLTNLLLVEPWRYPEDLDWMEGEGDLAADVSRRKKLILPHSSLINLEEIDEELM